MRRYLGIFPLVLVLSSVSPGEQPFDESLADACARSETLGTRAFEHCETVCKYDVVLRNGAMVPQQQTCFAEAFSTALAAQRSESSCENLCKITHSAVATLTRCRFERAAACERRFNGRPRSPGGWCAPT